MGDMLLTVNLITYLLPPWNRVLLKKLTVLTFSLLMELLVKPEILTSYIYGPTFGNAERRLFLFAAQCFNIESIQKVFLCHSCV
jgi:hypothetical protein